MQAAVFIAVSSTVRSVTLTVGTVQRDKTSFQSTFANLKKKKKLRFFFEQERVDAGSRIERSERKFYFFETIFLFCRRSAEASARDQERFMEEREREESVCVCVRERERVRERESERERERGE